METATDKVHFVAFLEVLVLSDDLPQQMELSIYLHVNI